ncbi:TerB family tellurite resistance protein [uncultured Oceanisphaera sp.]|uniref:TerB family tellurite resistance protein n=1 Tax=uncultured Oceanisphaera sp. TaxID=353858 RepID=UPI00261B5722|nr:TerB family tellurite resistance protein [uncultured Oceanisphaera sp.]
MFVQLLSSSQQEALLSLSKKLITADNYIDQREQLLLDTLRQQCCNNLNPDSDVNIDSLHALFAEEKQKTAFMLELIGVAHADENYQDIEKDFITQVAKKLAISTAHLQNLESWVKQQLLLTQEAYALLEN